MFVGQPHGFDIASATGRSIGNTSGVHFAGRVLFRPGAFVRVDSVERVGEEVNIALKEWVDD